MLMGETSGGGPRGWTWPRGWLRAVGAATLALLASCSAPPTDLPAPRPFPFIPANAFYAQQEFKGSVVFKTWALGRPLHIPVRVTGYATIIEQWPRRPHLTVDGVDVIVEPLPGKEAEAHAAVADGRLLVLRNGVRATLSPAGTAFPPPEKQE